MKRSPPSHGVDPSSSSSSSSTRKLKKESNKKKKSSSSNVADSSSLETSTTPLMAQALSTFNSSELTRFEAFRRSTFRGDAVAKYVSYCLANSSVRRHLRREDTRQCLGANGYGIDPVSERTAAALRRYPDISNQTDCGSAAEELLNVLPLEDLVAPGTSQEITVVVSSLAKAYSQRLVQSARALAAAEGYDNDAKLLPRHILEAHRHRVKAGVDPGFFMHPSRHSSGSKGALSATNNETPFYDICGPVGGSTTASAAALGIVDKNKLRLQAALIAQEEYDRQFSNDQESSPAKKSDIE